MTTRPPEAVLNPRPTYLLYGCVSCPWHGDNLAQLGEHLLRRTGHAPSEPRRVEVAPV